MAGRKDERSDEDVRESELEALHEAHDLAEGRAQIGTVARELELRELAVQHRAGYTEFVENLEKAAIKARKEGWTAGRRFLRTYLKADAHLLGRMNPVSAWYLRTLVRSPQWIGRLLDAGRVGDEERARLADYVEENGLQPAFEALWKQLGTAEEKTRPT
jgi:hypothetical protein